MSESDLKEIYYALCERKTALEKRIYPTDMTKYSLENVTPEHLVNAYEVITTPCSEIENESIYNATVVINMMSKIHANLELGVIKAQIRSVAELL
jgi:hypothetical protein